MIDGHIFVMMMMMMMMGRLCYVACTYYVHTPYVCTYVLDFISMITVALVASLAD